MTKQGGPSSYATAQVFHRVTVSVMAADIHVLILGFDQAYFIAYLIAKAIGTELEMTGFVDIKPLFEAICKDVTMT